MGIAILWRLGAVRVLTLAASLVLTAPAGANEPADGVATIYKEQVDRRLDIPMADGQHYALLAEQTLLNANLSLGQAQYVAVVDRAPLVQAILLYWRDAAAGWTLLGASPVSTGAPGSFDHFQTPLGVFAHSKDNPDFRAEGTRNSNGIRGYGAKGMRVFDFGWQQVPKGWGNAEVIAMRLQMHATDPDRLEQRLGSTQSKGCVRIPAALNRMLDHYGVLDADYEALELAGHRQWVLSPQRVPLGGAGRYLVIVDSGLAERPPWSPAPVPPHYKHAAAKTK